MDMNGHAQLSYCKHNYTELSAAALMSTRAGTIMRIERFPQHPLTAGVPCAVKLYCWDTPPTVNGTLTVCGPSGPTQGTL